MGELKSYKWFHDHLNQDEVHMLGITSTLVSTQTRFQQLEILETKSYGRCLVLDGKMQSSEVDEFIYHEALVHPAMLAHPDPGQVFIVGGGEGATLREVLRHHSVKSAFMVDIDQEVVESCKQYLPQWHQGSFDDPRVRLAFIDARKYLEETDETFDIIIIDLSEPVEEGPSYLLYTREFYSIVLDRLSSEGIIALQAGSTALTSLLSFSAVYQTLRTVFPIVVPYQAIVPSFGLPWGFVLASKKFDPRDIPPEEVAKRVAQRINGELRYYNGEIHMGQFLFPRHIRVALEKEDRIIEDNHPLFAYH